MISPSPGHESSAHEDDIQRHSDLKGLPNVTQKESLRAIVLQLLESLCCESRSIILDVESAEDVTNFNLRLSGARAFYQKNELLGIDIP